MFYLKKKKLYDFVKITQARSLNRSIYFIENNVKAYAKAFATFKEKCCKRDIVKID